MSKVTAIKSNVFKQAEHAYRRFDCEVDSKLIENESDLTNPDLWVNVSAKLNAGDEIRVVADDFSFVAYLFVTFTRGTDVRTKVINATDFEDVVSDMEDQDTGKYEIKHTGRGKYCIINKETGETVIKGPFDKMTAIRELDDYQKALLR